MSISRESILFVTALNLVLTVCVVWAGMTLFTPTPEPGAPGESKTRDDDLGRQVQALSERLAALETEQLEIGDLRGKILALEKAPRAMAPGMGATAEGKDGVGSAQPSMEAQLMKGIGQMIRQQARRQRDRFLNEILNPSPESERRQARQIQGITDAISRNLGLEERDKAAVQQILLDVDNKRRTRLREIVESKSSPDDVTYDEVKTVLDESFEEEDRLIEQTLPGEKADSYQSNAEPFRQFIYVAAQAAFPAANAEKKDASGK